MAIKIASPQWGSEATKNMTQRDALRTAFFADAGIVPATSIRQIFRPGPDRVASIMPLFDIAAGNKIEDSGLAAITALSKLALATTGLGHASLTGQTETRPFGMMAFAPEVYRNFFTTHTQSALLKSLL